MANTVTVPESAYKELLVRLSRVEKMLVALTEKFEQEPPEGTEAWWEWSDKKALEEYKRGDYYELRDKKELDDFFNNIHSDVSTEKYHHKVRR